jgi:hypothetical protein
MLTILAVEAEDEVTKSALTLVQIFIDVCNLRASWQRTPAHVIHLCDSVIKRKLLIFLHDIRTEIQILDVEITQHLFAALLSASEL